MQPRSQTFPVGEKFNGQFKSDWADKAAAIASYARQADDLQLENYARRIRLRAKRRCGELLLTFDARGGDRRSKTVVTLNFDRRPRKAVAEEAGLSEHKARTAVDIAAIPSDEFEAAVESDHPPGTEELARWLKRKRDHPQDDVRAVTQRSLVEISKSVAAVNAAEALLKFERNATECGVEMIVEILRGRAQKLERVRRAISLAFRLNSALDEAGNRGNPMLRGR